MEKKLSDIIHVYDNDVRLADHDDGVLVTLNEDDGLFIDFDYLNDRRIRPAIYERLLKAKAALPLGVHFILYEAYRPFEVQLDMWCKVWQENECAFPDDDYLTRTGRCDEVIANPFHMGSGHQFGCAIDISLCNDAGEAFDMGTPMHALHDPARVTNCASLTEEQSRNRRLLVSALEGQGFVNYPQEWWHYSYGDRLWAQLTGQKQTLFRPLRV
jgi:D-alanyl-D-alanine dipeptidase